MQDISIEIIKVFENINIDWIANLIGILIAAISSVGVGIIVFTLILKTVVLPFDIYQKVSMRKQSLKMEQMRPELEKLQKQYANDKAMYSQKMMEVYKKNNYSMFSACLPMILSMVILIVAFNELNAFSQYSNLSAYKIMVEEYNSAITSYSANADDCVAEEVVINGEKYTKYEGTDAKYFIYYIANESGVPQYQIDVEKIYDYDKDGIDALMKEDTALTEVRDAAVTYVKNIGSRASAEAFKREKVSFLWVKNIWYSDTAWTHSLGSYSDFTSKINKKVQVIENGETVEKTIKQAINSSDYENITKYLTEEKTDANGYFVLCVLSVGLMFLSQFLSMKSQKAQTDLGSVDGTNKSTQKMMMFIMPIMFGFFAFTYSAAFSIYMVVSSAYSILTMLLSNVIVDKLFHTKQEKELQAKYNRVIPTRNNSKKK